MSSAYETDEETVSPLRNIGSVTENRTPIVGMKAQWPDH